MSPIDRSRRPAQVVLPKPSPPPPPPPPPRRELHRGDTFGAATGRPPVELLLRPKVSAEQAQLEADPAFQALNPGVQQAVLETVNDPLIEASGKQTLIDAVTTDGFALLSTEEAEEFLEYAGNTIPGHGSAIRAELAAHLESDEFQNDGGGFWKNVIPDAVVEARELRQIAAGSEALPGSTPVGELPAAERDVTVTGPEDLGEFEFDTGEVDAERYTFEVDGREVEVIYPKDHPADAPSPEELETLLESLPDVAAREYDRILIEPRSSDASASTNGEGQVRIYPNAGRSLERLQSTLVHEAAHNLSRALGDDASIDVDGDLDDLSPGWRDWAEAIEADGHYVSDYAQSSATGDNDDDRRLFGEDFAETVELYYQVRGTPAEAEFARLYPNRYDIIREVVGDA